ncbi:hypothetical protein TIFTF001_019336 [Ficus carica]|uniref:Uncharacterized protein n=1 Tax=Ficus carica TaxID=3494 RepID=A0AA88A8V5_FICCA|nr:hypothetical protein TIFTF001_019336 [Ficus carica]
MQSPSTAVISVQTPLSYRSGRRAAPPLMVDHSGRERKKKERGEVFGKNRN